MKVNNRKKKTIIDKLSKLESKLTNCKGGLRNNMLQIAANIRPNGKAQEVLFQTTSQNAYKKYLALVDELYEKNCSLGVIDKKLIDGGEQTLVLTHNCPIVRIETPSTFPNNIEHRIDITYEGMVQAGEDVPYYAKITRKEQERVIDGKREVHVVFDGFARPYGDIFIRHYVYYANGGMDPIYGILDKEYMSVFEPNKDL